MMNLPSGRNSAVRDAPCDHPAAWVLRYKPQTTQQRAYYLTLLFKAWSKRIRSTAMTEYKKQHYLPKFFLRRFSEDGTGVFVYRVDDRTVQRRNIRSMASEHYFYADSSKAKLFEETMSVFEKSHSEILERINETEGLQSLTEIDRFELLRFILLVMTRTKESKMEAESMFNAVMDELKPNMVKSLQSQGLSITEDYTIRIRLNHSNSIGILFALKEGPVTISDLGFALLLNDTGLPFVCGDSPVILHNRILPGATALLSPGLLIIAPISEKIAILLFDKELYRFRMEANEIIRIKKERDIDELNRLQLINCLEFVLFSKESLGDYMMDLGKRGIRNLKKTPFAESFKRAESDGTHDYIVTRGKRILYEPRLSFIQINVRGARDLRRLAATAKGPTGFIAARNPEIARFVEELRGKESRG